MRSEQLQRFYSGLRIEVRRYCVSSGFKWSHDGGTEVTTPIIVYLQFIYERLKLKFRIENLWVRKRVKQECSVFSIIFNAYIQYALNRVREDMYGETINMIAFAHDIAIVAES